METIQYGNSKWKNVLLILICCGFVAIGIWMFQREDSEGFDRIIGIAGVLFFGTGIPLGIKKFFTKKAELELNDKSLILKPNSKQQKTLLWTQISGFDVLKFNGTKIIGIKLKDPQAQINNESNTLKKKVMQLNQKQFGSTFSIATSSLNVSSKNLLKQLEAFHKEYSEA